MKYEITKEQILQIMEWGNKKDAKMVREEWFPEAFKTVLEVGKWYKFESGTLGFYQGDNIESYGVHATSKEWFSSHAWFFNHNLNEIIIEATESEVLEALKNEAVRRYKVGDYIKTHQGTNVLKNLDIVHSVKYNKGIYNKQDYGLWLFMNGKWAEIIETITKEEAEKKFNCKII